MSRILSRSLLCLSLVSACAMTTPAPQETSADPELRRLVHDLCDARLVFLGEEGSHGGGMAMQLKGKVVTELVSQCGFNHVVFESQLYDFENLKHLYRLKTSTKADLYNALGGLWSTASEMDPLMEVLHQAARTGDLLLSGMDGQTGSATGIFSQQHLGSVLTRFLAEPTRAACKQTIDRLVAWKFDIQNPYDEAYKQKLQACANDAYVAADQAQQASASDKLVARSFRDSLRFTDADYFNQRDRLMHENLTSLLTALPRESKTIVWTANVHALRQPYSDKHAVASYPYPSAADAIKTVAIVALDGSYGRQGQPSERIHPASPESLERTAWSTQSASWRYVAKAELKRYDHLDSRLLGYGAYRKASWSALFDGVILLAREQPPSYVRPARPMERED